MIGPRILTVTPREAGLRLDRFVLGHVPEIPRALIAEAIEAGRIKVGGQTASKGLKVAAGETVVLDRLVEKAEACIRPNPGIPLDILHADKALLVLNKPAGMPVHPLKAGESDTLANGLVAKYPELAGIGENPLFPAMVHRLDTETSGLVMAARTPEAYEILRKQFKEQSVVKTYLALVRGSVLHAGRIEGFLEHDPENRGRMRACPDPGRKSSQVFRAITEYTPVEHYKGFSLLRVDIRSGVTHQIRCQLAGLGHPIVGDKVYAAAHRDNLGAKRHFLHAAGIALIHPVTGRRVRFESKLPEDLQHMLSSLPKLHPIQKAARS